MTLVERHICKAEGDKSIKRKEISDFSKKLRDSLRKYREKYRNNILEDYIIRTAGIRKYLMKITIGCLI